MKRLLRIASIAAGLLCALALPASSRSGPFIEVNGDLEYADELVAYYEDRGFDAGLYSSPGESLDEGDDTGDYGYSSPGEFAAIWLGEEVPLEYAVETIGIAYEHFPFLQYISLSRAGEVPDDMLREVFVGGATKTALEEGCRPISAGMFRQVSPGFADLAALHAFIGRKRGK